MSYPIHYCLVSDAARGDEKAYSQYIEAMTHNLRFGSYCTIPCTCEPCCPTPSEEQIAAFNKRVKEHFEKNPVESYDKEVQRLRSEAACNAFPDTPDEMDLNDGLDMCEEQMVNKKNDTAPAPTIAERALLLGCVVLVLAATWYFAGKI